MRIVVRPLECLCAVRDCTGMGVRDSVLNLVFSDLTI